MFSFVKELNEETGALVKALEKRHTLWGGKPRVAVWVFYVGDQREAAKAWWDGLQIKSKWTVLSIVSPEDAELVEWRLAPAKSNALVLGGGGMKIKGTWADVKAAELKALGPKLEAALAGKD